MKEEGHKIPDYQSLKDDPETYKQSIHWTCP